MLDRNTLIGSAGECEASERWPEAVALWKRAASDPSMTEHVVEAAFRAQSVARVREAEEILRVLVDAQPSLATPHFALGVLLEERGALVDARALLERGLELEERHDVLTILGSVQRRLNDDAGAQRSFARSLELNSENDEAHLGLARTLLRTDPRRAVLHFRRAIEASPEEAALHRELGEALWRAGQNQEAEVSIRHALTRDPRDAWAHDFLGHLLNARGELEVARQHFHLATEYDSSIPLFWCDLADALAAAGRNQEAERLYLRALSGGVDDASCNLRYGVFLRNTGRPGKARTYLSRAVELDPTLERARRLLNDLNDRRR